jgi:sigma-E factor negative regulatory protein RseC
MRTSARVRDVRDGRAWLACETAASTCDACNGGRGCALRWLTRAEGAVLEVPAEAADGRRLATGDGILLEVSDGELLRAALLAYLPPLAGLLAGAGGAAVLAPGGQATAMLASLAGLVAGWVVSRAWLRRSPPRYRLQVEAGP